MKIGRETRSTRKQKAEIRVSVFYQGCKIELDLNAYNPPRSSEARNAAQSQ